MRLRRAHIAFDDHPDAQRHAGRIETVTAGAMPNWMAGHWDMAHGLPGGPQRRATLREVMLT